VKLTTEQQSFLKSVSGCNEQFNAVRAGGSLIGLCHPFWSELEISKSLKLLSDWGVPTSLVPFYGDWHTLICLDSKDGVIQLLDDDRRTLFTWSSIPVFMASLVNEPEKPIDAREIIESESWLDF
jgi:hypothetical protein